MRDDEFRQYFPNERMEYAAREGYRWLSQPTGFDDYRREFEAFHRESSATIETILAGALDAASMESFFTLLSEYFVRYSKMDFQFTNLTYLYADTDPVVRANLAKLASFKDDARVWINQVSIDDDSAFARFLEEVSERFGTSPEDLQVAKIDEILALATQPLPPSEVLNDRRLSFAVYLDAGSVHYVVGQEAVDYVQRNRVLEESQAESEIVGQVAHRLETGRVEGVVRLINVDYADMDKMEQEIADMIPGEILVSEFTAPELMAACKKASAIVTDLGGMLSHAAIVSRELGIPCVVGTRHASRRLATGDRIGVDLASGHVEKLK
jgi:phosphohistidine swiveling domain-containing protein